MLIELLVDSFILSALWNCHPTPFWLPQFLMRKKLSVLLRISYIWVASPCFQDSLCIWLLTVWQCCILVWISLNLSYLKFVELEHGNFLNHIWEAFAHYVFQYSFRPLYSLLLFWDSHYLSVAVLDGVLQVSEDIFIFLFYFLFVL